MCKAYETPIPFTAPKGLYTSVNTNMNTNDNTKIQVSRTHKKSRQQLRHNHTRSIHRQRPTQHKKNIQLPSRRNRRTTIMESKKYLNEDLALVTHIILNKMKLNKEEMLSLFLSNETEEIKNILRTEAKRIAKGMHEQ